MTEKRNGGRGWLARGPFSILMGLAWVAIVVSAFSRSTGSGWTALVASLLAVVGLYILAILVFLPLLIPNLKRYRWLRRTFPASKVWNCQTSDDFIESMRLIDEQIVAGIAAENRGGFRARFDDGSRGPGVFGVVIGAGKLSFWLGSNDPRQVAEVGLSTVVSAGLDRRTFVGRRRLAVVVSIVVPEGMQELAFLPKSSFSLGLRALPNRELRRGVQLLRGINS